MTAGGGAEGLIPRRPSLKKLREAAAGCTACPLHADATQTVFGSGKARAAAVFVGEQPGDREDREGAPFVGPAGRLLDASLARAGWERDQIYLTNAVKHFKWRQGRGKRRIHQRPSVGEINACAPWLEAELSVVKPQLVVCLGATAARAVLGPGFRVTRDRGSFVEHELASLATGTIHPSALLRVSDRAERKRETAAFERDLSGARLRLEELLT